SCDLRMYVNGEQRQRANTADLKFSCADIIEYLSAAFTLEPGDLIPTGTPGGVGAAMSPPEWLKAGDVMTVDVEHLGRIESRVVNEPDDFVSEAMPKAE
ncbi:MAG: fumarylacetoacetate hydrolase family protein, partial [Pseudomonadota bacterium]